VTGRQETGPPVVARYAVASTSAPSIRQVVTIADCVHDALCKLSGERPGSAAVFTGPGGDGTARADHQHAHVFCESNGSRDAITHITIWAAMGFDEEACLVLRRLTKVWGHGSPDIRIVLQGIGRRQDFPDCAFFGESKVWRSYTPFVGTRHAKRYRDGRPKIDANGWQTGSAGHDLLRLLALHPWGGGAIIKQYDERDGWFRFGGQRLRSDEFETVRRGGKGSRGEQNGAAFALTFPRPVPGPLALGYGAHFGLGLFVPVAGGR
jgi:CRISPR-associated protein Csb2